MDRKLFERWMKETHLVRPPTTRLSTFGATRIDYHLVSPMDGEPAKTRLREGSVLSEKPAVLTPDSLRERFEGFGEQAGDFKDFIDSRYGELPRTTLTILFFSIMITFQSILFAIWMDMDYNKKR